MATTTDDPVFGQHLRFTTDDRRLVVDLELDPGGKVPRHLHPTILERWTLLEGAVEFVVDGRPVRPAADETLVVEPGVRHELVNLGERPARLRVDVEPPGEMQAFLEEAAAFNREGRLTPRGLPRSWAALRDAATFVLRHAETTVLLLPPPFPPRIVQRAIFPLLARRE